MYNLLISIGLAMAVTVGVQLAGFPLYAGIIPGTLTLLASYIVLARRILRKIQSLVSEAHKELSTPATNVKDQKQRADKAIRVLESGLAYSRWQFFVAAQIQSAIGQIRYLLKDLDGAMACFSKAHPRDYMALAMKGALHFQRKEYAAMEKAFDAAIKPGKKEAVIWAVYAWCLLQLDKRDQALKLMARAVEVNPSDEKLKAGLTALQNDRKLKMKPFEPLWWNFGLEKPPLQTMGPRVKFMRR